METIYEIVFVIAAVRAVGIAVGFVWKEVNKMKKQRGVTVVEYAIMLALIAIAIAATAPGISSAVVNVFAKASSVMAMKP